MLAKTISGGLSLILLLAGLFFHVNVSGQDRDFFLKPTGASFDALTYGMWEFNDGLTGQSLNELRLRGQLYTRSGLGLLIENKSRFFPDQATENDFSQVYLQYAHSFSHKGWFPLFKNGTNLLVKAGRIEWYPVFKDIRLISENLELYRQPYSFHGLLVDLNMPLLKDKSLALRFNAHSNDIIEGDEEARIRNLYVSYRKNIYKKFGIAAQLGEMEGTRYLVNYAYFFYRPVIEKVQLGFKAGKLLSLDEIPYGFEVRIEREFNFIALGAYYQRRIDQQAYFEELGTNSQIFGFTWRFLKPRILKHIMDTYQLVYDTNTETLRFVIPILLSNFDFK
ncbi:MAG: hypothetical protein K9G58_06030 [Bacteroidales bacterium]|nr:hypothetical protein [Bacteroidales bacterium]MCF8397705.1 hypothetical protein [Bacteroidales bacterium]